MLSTIERCAVSLLHIRGYLYLMIIKRYFQNNLEIPFTYHMHMRLHNNVYIRIHIYIHIDKCICTCVCSACSCRHLASIGGSIDAKVKDKSVQNRKGNVDAKRKKRHDVESITAGKLCAKLSCLVKAFLPYERRHDVE